MYPEYLKVLNNPPDNVKFAQIDCQADNAFCQSLNITAYPRVIFFSDGLLTNIYLIYFILYYLNLSYLIQI